MIKIKKPIAKLKKNEETMAGPKPKKVSKPKAKKTKTAKTTKPVQLDLFS